MEANVLAFDVSTLTSINQTGLLVALRRAVESRRQDALFHDALAESVADGLARSQMSPKFWAAAEEMAALSGDAVALRTRHYDDQIHAAVRRGLRQIVILGVGLDGRSCRLNFDLGTKFFQVDQLAVLNARQALLEAAGAEPKYSSYTISSDLPADDLSSKLRAAGFRSDTPSVFVAEGLVYYLTSKNLKRLVAQISSLAAPGSLLLAEYPAADALTKRNGDADLSVTADFDKERRIDPWTLLESTNWLLECHTLTNLAGTFGRSLPVEIDEPRGGARWWYVSAVRI
jgi:methyltransferase (TIGR00027 family)